MKKIKLLIDFDNTIFNFTYHFIEKVYKRFEIKPSLAKYEDRFCYYDLFSIYDDQLSRMEYDYVAKTVMDDNTFYELTSTVDDVTTRFGRMLLKYLHKNENFYKHLHTKSHTLDNAVSKICLIQDEFADYFDKYTFDVGSIGNLITDAKYNDFDVIIDDNASICVQALRMYPNCKVMMVCYQYNDDSYKILKEKYGKRLILVHFLNIQDELEKLLMED